MLRWLQVVVLLVAFVFAGALGRALVKSKSNGGQRPVTSEHVKMTERDIIIKELQLMENELMSECPKPAGPGITLISCSAGPGVVFTYSYRIDQKTLASLDVAKEMLELRPRLIAQYKSNPDMQWFRKRNVGLRYRYSDERGEVIGTIDISPADFY